MSVVFIFSVFLVCAQLTQLTKNVCLFIQSSRETGAEHTTHLLRACVCIRVCVHACVCVCVRACVSVKKWTAKRKQV